MSKLVVASYCTTFLKSEMLHIYRQVTGLRDVQTFVMTKKMQNTDRFPFEDIEVIPAPRQNPFRHGWLKFVERQPPIVYRGEYQLLGQSAWTARCRFDAYLFRPHRGSPAPLHPMLG